MKRKIKVQVLDTFPRKVAGHLSGDTGGPLQPFGTSFCKCQEEGVVR